MQIPLATRMRPRTLDEFYGQDHLLGINQSLRCLYNNKRLHSLILWGSSGTGKTTLAKILAENINARVVSLSAVLAGVKEIREVVEQAKQNRLMYQQDTVLFVDEVHRFNKAQQDAFLPHVEDGSIILLGATTENPSFALNNALLSRVRVYVLKHLSMDVIKNILSSAIYDKERGLAIQNDYIVDDEVLSQIAQMADGDARQALNLLEICTDFAEDVEGKKHINSHIIQQVLTDGVRRFDKHGDIFHEQISALHKSVRGSDPDASLYWLMRMLDGGCDPLYIARRVVRMASEDIGNADPVALNLALNAWQTYERLGSPEGELAIAQAVIYLAVTAKSNAVYVAFNEAKSDMQRYGSSEVPMHLRNATTRLMRNLEFGKNYRYAHDEPNAYVPNENYFPDNMPKQNYYRPVNRGMEQKIIEKMAYLRSLDSKDLEHNASLSNTKTDNKNHQNSAE